ncbi:Hypothetical protein, putative [Bodo saltans]|uniref:Vacuolar import/degradation Vid27 C-terminal domain-containing protein n=1 Tax=Bodo saltans TaxID=75058 RepID=A0A0S4JLV5_BODSA|nr:Hypothetical protein, putative [Bodo saltans]|eukprot:CUG92514.1 Hypothetical protein, putative [Bodo saltans]
MGRNFAFGCRGTFCVKRGSKYDPVGAVDSFMASIEVEGKKSWIVVRCGTDVEFEGEVTTSMVVQFHIETGSVFWTALLKMNLSSLHLSLQLTPQQNSHRNTRRRHLWKSTIDASTRLLRELLFPLKTTTKSTTSLLLVQRRSIARPRMKPCLGWTLQQYSPKQEKESILALQTLFNLTEHWCFKHAVASQLLKRTLSVAMASLATYKSLKSPRKVFKVLFCKLVTKRCSILTRSRPSSMENFASWIWQQVSLFKRTNPLPMLEVSRVFGTSRSLPLRAQIFWLDGELRELDLATGVIVQTYEPAADSGGIKSVRYLKKFATESPNLLSCISSNAAFVVDTRLDPKKCAVVDDGKEFSDYQYRSLKKDQHFTCHATSRNGFLAVGDQSGAVRLYTGPPGGRKAEGGGHHAKLAKTLIELATPVLHLDVTNDGEFVIVTTKDRILVLCTLYVDDKKKEKNGFEGRMGKQKPSPLALLPSPAQVLRMGGANAVDFAKATLEGVDGSEQWIVAVCGTMICTWSMARVREAVKTHSVVYCETKDAKRGTLLGAEIRNDRVEFLSSDALGMQLRSKETKKKTGGFSFYSD